VIEKKGNEGLLTNLDIAVQTMKNVPGQRFRISREILKS